MSQNDLTRFLSTADVEGLMNKKQFTTQKLLKIFDESEGEEDNMSEDGDEEGSLTTSSTILSWFDCVIDFDCVTEELQDALRSERVIARGTPRREDRREEISTDREEISSSIIPIDIFLDDIPNEDVESSRKA